MIPRTPRRARAEGGQAAVEFIIIFWFAFSLLMLVIQIVLMFNAHSMVKLAAFNAARAAIVARAEDSDKPEEPVTLEEMQDKARLAAFITVLPVIPGFHARKLTVGQIPGLANELVNSVTSIDSLSAITALLKGHGQGVLAALVEFLVPTLFEVKFVDPTADDPLSDEAEIEDWQDEIEFDDTGRAADNRIKVVVEWQYPLVIPLADHVIYALVNPSMYALAYIEKGRILDAIDVMTGGLKRRPVWEIGWGLRSPDVFGPWNVTGFRIPIRGSYVMRMQWDRKPGE